MLDTVPVISAAPMLAQVGATLDAADRLGHATATVILAAATLGLLVVVGYLAREVMRLQNARRADAEKHAADRLATSERHAAEMLALQGQTIPKIAEVREIVEALSGVAESLTDARDEYTRATPLSTPTVPPPRSSRGGKS